MNEQRLDSIVAVNAQRLTTLEGVVYDMVDLHKTASATQQNIGKTLELLQQSYTEFTDRYKSEIEPKVKTMWENRSQIKGGYIVISLLCGFIVGGSIVAGTVLVILHK